MFGKESWEHQVGAACFILILWRKIQSTVWDYLSGFISSRQILEARYCCLLSSEQNMFWEFFWEWKPFLLWKLYFVGWRTKYLSLLRAQKVYLVFCTHKRANLSAIFQEIIFTLTKLKAVFSFERKVGDKRPYPNLLQKLWTVVCNNAYKVCIILCEWFVCKKYWMKDCSMTHKKEHIALHIGRHRRKNNLIIFRI